MSGLLNKAKVAAVGAKDALSKDKTHGSSTNDPHYDNPHSTSAGPHSSNLTNKVDPRIDSDRDGRNDPTSRTGGYGNTQAGDYNTTQTGGYGSGNTGVTSHGHTTGGYSDGPGSTGGYGNTTGSGYDNPNSSNDGPHRSNFANKVDPRVDSDRDNRNDPSSRVGGHGTQDQYSSGSTGNNYGSHGAGYDNPRSTNDGPHGSNLMNKVDPRVDSDRDNRNDPTSRVGGYGGQDQYGSSGTGYTGSGGHQGSTNYGEHNSNFANRVDPRIDSDRDGSRTMGSGPGATTRGYDNSQSGHHGQHGHHGHHEGGEAQKYMSVGSGNSDNAGPHNSNLMNKLDPRVDSDLSGGKTYGSNQTTR